jgi:DNA-binding NtrC family response regulator
LLVDDEDAFRLGLGANLEDDGHAVVQYAEPAAVAANVATVVADVAVLDYEMPGMNGLALADALHAAHPHLAVLLVTAYWTPEVEQEVARRPFMQLGRKPVDYDTLHRAVHRFADRTRHGKT